VRKRNTHIQDVKPEDKSPFVTWADNVPGSWEKAQAVAAKAYDAIRPVTRVSASVGNDANLSVRNGMGAGDYEIFRPGESVPRSRTEILRFIAEAYNRNGIIRTIFDLMTDFTTRGIKIVHPNPQVEQFYQNWWEKVDGQGRSDHFVNNLYLMGAAIFKRDIAKLSARVSDEIQRGVASDTEWAALGDDGDSPAYDITPSPAPRQPRSTVPYNYTFLNPQTISMIGGDLAIFSGNGQYGLSIPDSLTRTIRSPRTADDINLVNTLPSYITNAVNAGLKVIKLDPNKIGVYHYKKQDWHIWASPILYAVLDDIILLQKMKLADFAALDGATSHVCIWKIGSLQHHIIPTQASIDKLNDILSHAGNGQRLDLIWGPDIEIQETKSDIANFLGDKKYTSVLAAIYAGLGVPPTLVGGAGGEKGFTNNFFSLKTLLERIAYGREQLTKFWKKELRMVQQAMQFRLPAQIEYKYMSLTDEAAYNSLLVDMLDRDVISVEAVREHLGFIPDIEEAKVRREFKQRLNKKLPPKAGPFHEAEPDLILEKIFAQTGAVTPTEVGLELNEPKPGEVTPLQLQNDQLQHSKKMDIKNLAQNKTATPGAKNVNKSTKLPNKKGQQGEGRPPGSKDTTRRATKKVNPRTSGSEFLNLELWAGNAQAALADIVHPVFLKLCNKKSIRALSNEETEKVEHLKYALLCNLEPYSSVDKLTVGRLMSSPLPANAESDQLWKALVATFMQRRGRAPSINEIRQIQSYVYALNKLEGQTYGESDDNC
jgi:hypothetical protein